MFGPPPYPPKDYEIRNVTACLKSSPQFTPDCLPRVTQSNLGLYAFPIQYGEGEVPKIIEHTSVNPLIMENWTNKERALWVDKPGKDDFLIHDVFKNYSVTVDTYNPNWKPQKVKVFNRSYKYELVCLEENRLHKLRDKCQKEVAEIETNFKQLNGEEHNRLDSSFKVQGCKMKPPFWWKIVADAPSPTDDEKTESCLVEEKKYEKFEEGRWAPEPSLTATVINDPCRRKYDMLKVGAPFKTEACKFYYENYPPPNL